jgi:hypothetical protein
MVYLKEGAFDEDELGSEVVGQQGRCSTVSDARRRKNLWVCVGDMA